MLTYASPLVFIVLTQFGVQAFAANDPLPNESVEPQAVHSTLTADNHYGLFTGTSDGKQISYVGRNEKGAFGQPGIYNWSSPETWDFLIQPGEYIYLSVWDDDRNQAWLGEFSWKNGYVSSNINDWVFSIIPYNNPGKDGNVPDLETLAGYVAQAQWQYPVASTPNGTGVWYTVNQHMPIEGISSSASWLWHDTLDFDSQSDNGIVLFRSAAPIIPVQDNASVNDIASAIPEPADYALMLAGLATVGLACRRKMV